jgi:hypoxanthine phosphoribosyltransferase
MEQFKHFPRKGFKMEKITLFDRQFTLSIMPSQIQEAVSRVASEINRDLAGETPLFLGILNGSFMFMADLMRHMRMNCLVSFVRLSSYQGTSSSGTIREIIGLNEDIRGRQVVLVEDIVDSGKTLEALMARLQLEEPARIRIATLLLKPGCFSGKIPPDYVGIEVPDDFIVGYGLDYNGLGRHYKGIYSIDK